MIIRTFQPGDDAAQVSIYNEAAADLPKFKPATLDEVRRRCRGPDFDPATRLFALSDGRPTGYISFHANGRLSYPWCRKGHEGLAEPLLERALEAMRQRGLTRALAAYRADWAPQHDFFLRHGFQQTREMINFVMDMAEMPTPAARANSIIAPLTAEDVPAVMQLFPAALRVQGEKAFTEYALHNPYFPPQSAFVLRGRSGGPPVALGILVANPAYAHPKQVDSAMPCFRLGAIGTEGMSVKRINGLFSFLAADTRDVSMFGLDLIAHAAFRLQDTEVETFGAQVASDVPHLYRFYKQYFRRQGAFPVYERAL